MKLNEVTEHNLIWMTNLLMRKKVKVRVDIEHSTSEALLVPKVDPRNGQPSSILGTLIYIEKRGQAGGTPTVVINYYDDYGDDHWQYYYDWALDHLELEKMEDGYLLKNKST